MVLPDDQLRRATAQVVASLTSAFGAEHLDLVEDATQDALVAMLRTAAHSGPLSDTPSWLYRVARNRAIDLLRQGGRFTPLEHAAEGSAAAEWREQHERDDEIRMLLMCCHPSLPMTGRVALALSIVGGLTAAQIARALLMSEAAVRQVIVRAKRRLREKSVTLAVAGSIDLEARLDAALATIYLIFNEGYFSLDGDRVVRTELCHEAVRMCGVLLDAPPTDKPQVYALGALLAFQMSRMGSRIDSRGDLVPFVEQDRTGWDARQIALGFQLLDSAGTGDTVTTYHLEAEIASYHARSQSSATTEWDAIVRGYDALAALNPSPVVLLNRAVAIAERDGPTAGLEALEGLAGSPALAGYPFYHTTCGTLLQRAGRLEESRQAFGRALALATSAPVQRFIAARVARNGVSKTGDLKRVR